jgi:hypothetical protein
MQDPPKFSQITILGLKIKLLATLAWTEPFQIRVAGFLYQIGGKYTQWLQNYQMAIT